MFGKAVHTDRCGKGSDHVEQVEGSADKKSAREFKYWRLVEPSRDSSDEPGGDLLVLTDFEQDIKCRPAGTRDQRPAPVQRQQSDRQVRHGADVEEDRQRAGKPKQLVGKDRIETYSRRQECDAGRSRQHIHHNPGGQPQKASQHLREINNPGKRRGLPGRYRIASISHLSPVISVCH